MMGMVFSTAENTFERPTHHDIQSTIQTVKRMLAIAGILALIGYVL